MNPYLTVWMHVWNANEFVSIVGKRTSLCKSSKFELQTIFKKNISKKIRPKSKFLYFIVYISTPHCPPLTVTIPFNDIPDPDLQSFSTNFPKSQSFFMKFPDPQSLSRNFPDPNSWVSQMHGFWMHGFWMHVFWMHGFWMHIFSWRPGKRFCQTFFCQSFWSICGIFFC